MDTFSQVPPGFRFHPTDEELVDYYLRKKVASRRIDLDVIKEIDLYKIEPWDLQEKCKIGTEEQNEWYFFSHKDKKYPTGTRTNRATTAGFWKATGRDKAIYSKHNLIGMRKTLVFYKGRAPNGQKSNWIMHEYRLETNENVIPQEEGWAVCRAFKKRMPVVHKVNRHESPCWYTEQVSFMPNLHSPKRRMITQPHDAVYHYSCKQELEAHNYLIPPQPFLQLPHSESSKLPTIASYSCHDVNSSSLAQEDQIQQDHQNQISTIFGDDSGNGYSNIKDQAAVDQVTDWRILDKFVASQFSPEDVPKEPLYLGANILQVSDHIDNLIQHNRELTPFDYPSTSTSGSQSDLWM